MTLGPADNGGYDILSMTGTIDGNPITLLGGQPGWLPGLPNSNTPPGSHRRPGVFRRRPDLRQHRLSREQFPGHPLFWTDHVLIQPVRGCLWHSVQLQRGRGGDLGQRDRAPLYFWPPGRLYVRGGDRNKYACLRRYATNADHFVLQRRRRFSGRRSGTLHLGNDNRRLRRPRLRGLSQAKQNRFGRRVTAIAAMNRKSRLLGRLFCRARHAARLTSIVRCESERKRASRAR